MSKLSEFHKPITMFLGAPKLLLDRIHIAREILAKAKITSGNTDSWKSWNTTTDAMFYAWQYMQSLNWVIQENAAMRAELRYLRTRNAFVESELAIYHSIQTCISMQDLPEKVEAVKTAMDLGIDKFENIFND